MAEYWVSIGHKWCDYCKKFIKDTKVDWQRHEQGPFHRENVQKRLVELRQQSAEKQKEDEKLNKHIQQLANAASRQARQDEADSANLAQFSQYSTYKPKSSGQSNTAPAAATAAGPGAAKPKEYTTPLPDAAQVDPFTEAYNQYTQQQWQAYYAQYGAYQQQAAAYGQNPAAAQAWAAYYAQQQQRQQQQQQPSGNRPPVAPVAPASAPIKVEPAHTDVIKQEVKLEETQKEEKPKPTTQGGLQWEEVTEDALYSSSYRPASPESHHGKSSQKSTMAEKKRKRGDGSAYDGIDHAAAGGAQDDDDDYASIKRAKPNTVYEDDDNGGATLVWKKRNKDGAGNKSLRKRTL